MDTRDNLPGPPRARRAGQPPASHRRQPARAWTGGAEGNERLTALTGTVLLLLLAAEGVTILRLGRLLTLHFFIGMLLLGPVVLKAGSTIYRFARYYTGSAPYRRKGPPAPLLRLLGPVIIASTAGVFGTGIVLAVAGPVSRQPWLFLHKASFVIWFCAMTVHVLAYLPRLPSLLAAESRGAAGHSAQGATRGAAGGPSPGARPSSAAAVFACRSWPPRSWPDW